MARQKKTAEDLESERNVEIVLLDEAIKALKEKKASHLILGKVLRLVDEIYGIGILVQCQACNCYHPKDFTGDCRDDANRFVTYDGERE
jgi:hypothetical protein